MTGNSLSWKSMATRTVLEANRRACEMYGYPPERMKGLIHEWAEAYDRVIIDTAPITAVTDPVLLSRLVDGAVILIQSGATSRRIIAEGIRQILDVQGRILGAVLNNVDTHHGGYYYHYYKHYYYGEGDKKKRKHRK